MLSVFDHGRLAPCPAPFNMAAYVLSHAKTDPTALALRVLNEDAGEDWTYGALERAVLGTATGLLAQGALPGDEGRFG